MNCTDFLAKLTDYFDGQIEPELLGEVREHLSACHHCEVIVDTTRHTIGFYREHQPYEFPEELAARLRSAVMERCRGALPAMQATRATAAATATAGVANDPKLTGPC